MMCFGWRPQPSCYTQDGQTVSNTATNCDSPNWWYWLMASAAIAGFALRSKKK